MFQDELDFSFKTLDYLSKNFGLYSEVEDSFNLIGSAIDESLVQAPAI